MFLGLVADKTHGAGPRSRARQFPVEQSMVEQPMVEQLNFS